MANIGPLELIVVLVIALVVLGPKRLPDAGKALGKGIREFRVAISRDEATQSGAEPPVDGIGSSDADKSGSSGLE